jgi:hypothetical protein
MLFVAASALSPSEIALLGNNIRPRSGDRRRAPVDQANRRVLAGVNRSLVRLRERVDGLYSCRPACGATPGTNPRAHTSTVGS